MNICSSHSSLKTKELLLPLNTTKRFFHVFLSLLVKALVCIFWYYLWILFVPKGAGNNAKVSFAIHIPLPAFVGLPPCLSWVSGCSHKPFFLPIYLWLTHFSLSYSGCLSFTLISNPVDRVQQASTDKYTAFQNQGDTNSGAKEDLQPLMTL